MYKHTGAKQVTPRAPIWFWQRHNVLTDTFAGLRMIKMVCLFNIVATVSYT